MTWVGSIELIGGEVRGALEDDWGWSLYVIGKPITPNRLTLAAALAERGLEVRAEHNAASRREHDALEQGAQFTGDLVREQMGLSRFYRWRGNLTGPWQMRLTMPATRWERGPIPLKGEPVI